MKTNLILLAAFVLLLIPSTLQVCASKEAFVSYEALPRLFEGFNEERVAFVVIEKPEEADQDDPAPLAPVEQDPETEVPRKRIAFMRDNQDWVVAEGDLAGVKVRGTDVRNRILGPVGNIRITAGSRVVDNATDEQLQDMELDDRQATLLRLLDPNQSVIAALRIGTDAGRGRFSPDAVSGTFVMREDVKQNLRPVFVAEHRFGLDVDHEYWVDRQVLSLDQGTITAVELSNPKGTLSLEKQEGEWKAVEAPEGVGALRRQEVTTLLSRISNVDVTRYAGPLRPAELAAKGLEPPEIRVKATTQDGRDHVLRVGRKVPDRNDHYAAVDGNAFLLYLGEWNVTPYEKDPKDFFDPAPAGDPATQEEPEEKPGEKPEEERPREEAEEEEEAREREEEDPRTSGSGEGGGGG